MLSQVYTLSDGKKFVDFTDVGGKVLDVKFYLDGRNPNGKPGYTYRRDKALVLWDELVGKGYNRIL